MRVNSFLVWTTFCHVTSILVVNCDSVSLDQRIITTSIRIKNFSRFFNYDLFSACSSNSHRTSGSQLINASSSICTGSSFTNISATFLARNWLRFWWSSFFIPRSRVSIVQRRMDKSTCPQRRRRQRDEDDDDVDNYSRD